MRRRRRPAKTLRSAGPNPASRVNPKRAWGTVNVLAIIMMLGIAVLLFGPYFGPGVVHIDLEAAVPGAPAASPSGDEAAPAPAPDAPEAPEKSGKRHKASKTAAADDDTPAKAKEAKEGKEGKESKAAIKADRLAEDQFFDAQGVVPYFKVEFLPEEWEYIRKDPRRYAEATMTEGDDPKLYKGVAVKLKGSAGSFQNADARPGLSISMNKYQKAERWNGFLKWHLNNGVQDNSFLNEQISCEMARKAGVPASRCAHALLKWQGRDLGLYVFKEAFDRDFLAKFFKNTEGDLYDGGFVADVHVDMEKDQGDRLRRDNIKELVAACQEGDPKKRWERLEKIVDIDEFLSFIAIEAIVCHWDGYNFNRNNYRVYFDADSGKAVFFLHGTDQTFGDANFPITRDSGAMVGQAILSNPEWKKGYREHVQKIYDEVLKPIDWPARVVEVGEKVKAALALRDPNAAKEYQNRINEARGRVASRIQAVAKQLGNVPKPFNFDQKGMVKLGGDGWNQEGTAAALDGAVVDGRPCFHIRADGETTGSWRKTVTLGPGKYRFTGRLRTTGVVATLGNSGAGAGVRISGGTRIGINGISGDSQWKEVTYDFESPGGDVVLVAELRASKGEVWFERDSFRLQQAR